MTRTIFLTSDRTNPHPLHSSWTARWDSAVESGRTIGEAVDRIVRHSPDGRLDSIALVIREGAPFYLDPASSAADRRPIRLSGERMAAWLETKRTA